MDRGRVSVLVYHGKPETGVQVRKGQLPRISEATSIGYELRSYRMDVVVHRRSRTPFEYLNNFESVSGVLCCVDAPSVMPFRRNGLYTMSSTNGCLRKNFFDFFLGRGLTECKRILRLELQAVNVPGNDNGNDSDNVYRHIQI